jgi:hypothetical protein
MSYETISEEELIENGDYVKRMFEFIELTLILDKLIQNFLKQIKEDMQESKKITDYTLSIENKRILISKFLSQCAIKFLMYDLRRIAVKYIRS